MKSLKTTAKLLTGILITTWATGCVHTPKGYVAKEWSSTMRELGIVPVFPPREDVQVGDIYIAPVSPDAEVKAFKKKEFLPLGLWLATLDVTTNLSNFYSNRASFPTTTTNTVAFMKELTNNPFAGLPQAQDSTRNIFVGGDTSRLRMVGFPSFMSATFNKGDLAAVVPVEAVNLALGAGFSSSRSATVSVPVAESYGLPADRIWDLVMDPNGELKPSVIKVKNEQLNLLVSFKQAIKVTEKRTNQVTQLVTKQVTQLVTNYFAPLRVITEVFYTRALDVSISSQTTRGAGLAGKPLATDALATAAAAAGAVAGAAASAATNSNSSGSSSNAPVFIMAGVTNLTGNAVERAAEMNRSLDQAMTQTVPGGSIKFVAAGDRGVTLRRTYDRPIAIGYRYFTAFVKIGTPMAPGDGTMSGWTPTGIGDAFLSPTNQAPSSCTSKKSNNSVNHQPGTKVNSKPK